MRYSSFFFMLLAISCQAQAQIHFVPAEFPTIQSAIDQAEALDTIVIEEGDYPEGIVIDGIPLIIASRYILDGDTSHIRNVRLLQFNDPPERRRPFLLETLIHNIKDLS